MTIQELYDWAKEHGCLDADMYVHDEGDFFLKVEVVEEIDNGNVRLGG